MWKRKDLVVAGNTGRGWLGSRTVEDSLELRKRCVYNRNMRISHESGISE
jgi:hypothetical protein